MKYILILLVSATVSLISVTGKIPDYIKVCKRNDPQISKCVEESIHGLKTKLAEGIPELEVPPLDPIYLEKLTFNLGPGFKAEGRDLVMAGGSNFDIRDLDVDAIKNVCSFTISFPEISGNGTYEIDAAIAGIPLRGSGPIHLRATSITGRGTLRGKNVLRNGKVYNWFPSMNMKFDIGDYEIKIDNLFMGDPVIGEATNRLLNTEKKEVLSSFLPELERVLITHTLLVSNNVVKHFTWDELFPPS